MTLRELLVREGDRAASQHVAETFVNNPDGYSVAPGLNEPDYEFQAGFNRALALLWPVVEALEKYRGQASRQQKGPTFYSEADEAFAELNNKLNKEEKHGTKT